jgi:hypothetical protein
MRSQDDILIMRDGAVSVGYSVPTNYSQIQNQNHENHEMHEKT